MSGRKVGVRRKRARHPHPRSSGDSADNNGHRSAACNVNEDDTHGNVRDPTASLIRQLGRTLAGHGRDIWRRTKWPRVRVLKRLARRLCRSVGDGLGSFELDAGVGCEARRGGGGRGRFGGGDGGWLVVCWHVVSVVYQVPASYGQVTSGRAGANEVG